MQALFELSDTQAQMQASLARWLADNAPFERRAALLQSPAAIAPVWRGLGHELGLLGAALPEFAGGQGGGLADHGLILQTLGGALLPGPYLACVVQGAGLLRRLPGALPRQLLAGVVTGDVRPVLTTLEPGARHDLAQVTSSLSGGAGAQTITGRKTMVRAAPFATHWLVSARGDDGLLRLALVNPASLGITRRDFALADGGWAAELAFSSTPVDAVLGEPGQDLLPLIEWVNDEAQLATGAEAVGVMQRLLQDTLDYVRGRKQFGVPIASFQALQHRLADMQMALLQANALVGATLLQFHSLDDDGVVPAPQRRRAVASAQMAVARACRSVGQGAVQLHGGMGMTDELRVGHAFKRLTVIEGQGGGLPAQLRRVAGNSPLFA